MRENSERTKMLLKKIVEESAEESAEGKGKEDVGKEGHDIPSPYTAVKMVVPTPVGATGRYGSRSKNIYIGKIRANSFRSGPHIRRPHSSPDRQQCGPTRHRGDVSQNRKESEGSVQGRTLCRLSMEVRILVRRGEKRNEGRSESI